MAILFHVPVDKDSARSYRRIHVDYAELPMSFFIHRIEDKALVEIFQKFSEFDTSDKDVL